MKLSKQSMKKLITIVHNAHGDPKILAHMHKDEISAIENSLIKELESVTVTLTLKEVQMISSLMREKALDEQKLLLDDLDHIIQEITQ